MITRLYASQRSRVRGRKHPAGKRTRVMPKIMVAFQNIVIEGHSALLHDRGIE